MVNRKSIEVSLSDFWPPDRVLLKCDVCGETLWDSKTAGLRRDSPIEHSLPYVSGLMRMEALKHQSKTGNHYDYDIRINKPSPVKEIELNVTVNGEEI